MNLHGSTLTGGTIAVPLFGFFTLSGTSNVIILSAFLVIAIFSLLFAIGMVTRFFINLKKYGAVLSVPERQPDNAVNK